MEIFKLFGSILIKSDEALERSIAFMRDMMKE